MITPVVICMIGIIISIIIYYYILKKISEAFCNVLFRIGETNDKNIENIINSANTNDMTSYIETYWIDFGTAKLYYTVVNDTTVISKSRKTTISKQTLLDYLAIAKELGHKTGKI